MHLDDTDCVRVLHGVASGRPGLTVDRYGPILLVQTWRAPLGPGELDAIAAEHPDLVAVWNHRPTGPDAYRDWHDPEIPEAPIGREHGLRFDVRPRHRGQDPLLFLDLRAGRRHVRAHAAGKTVLNLFAYTGAVGVAALAGGATAVLNVDFAESALEVARHNAALNGVADRFETLQDDFFPVIRQLAGLPVGGRRGKVPRFHGLKPRQFDVVVLDPPRWAKSAWGAVDVVRDYPSLLKPALLATAPGGHLLATNHHPAVALDDWLPIVRRTAEKAGRPLREIHVIPPDPDFPSFDGAPPLKMAWLAV